MAKVSAAPDQKDDLFTPASNDLWLTAFRLRMEYAGGEDNYLEALNQKMAAEADDSADESPKQAAESENQAPEEVEFQEDSKSGRRRKRCTTWKEWAGRSEGTDRWQPGDFTRGLIMKLNEKRRSGVSARCKAVFNPVGANIELQRRKSAILAARKVGTSDGGVVVTAEPLIALPAQKDAPAISQYYMEIKVLEVRRGVAGTLAVGFLWGDEPLVEEMPQKAMELQNSFVAGGDPPRAYLGGRAVREGLSWRPIIHLGHDSVVGVLLEVGVSAAQQEATAHSPGSSPSKQTINSPGNSPLKTQLSGCPQEAHRTSLRMQVFQDDKKVTDVSAEISENDLHLDIVPHEAPRGVIDVCGSVEKVCLVTGSLPPTCKEHQQARLQAPVFFSSA